MIIGFSNLFISGGFEDLLIVFLVVIIRVGLWLRFFKGFFGYDRLYYFGIILFRDRRSVKCFFWVWIWFSRLFFFV